MTNRLYYGDNLDVLRDHIASDSIDLVYLDPPFNSNAGYNVLFKSASGSGADASIETFDDTWSWGESAQNALLDIAAGTNRPLTVMMEAMRTAIGENPLIAYLAMMAVRSQTARVAVRFIESFENTKNSRSVRIPRCHE